MSKGKAVPQGNFRTRNTSQGFELGSVELRVSIKLARHGSPCRRPLKGGCPATPACPPFPPGAVREGCSGSGQRGALLNAFLQTKDGNQGQLQEGQWSEGFDSSRLSHPFFRDMASRWANQSIGRT